MSAYDDIAFECGAVVPALSKCLRAMFVARPGCKLVGGDFSNVEGRIGAWLAGEDWKLDAFRDYDAGTGPDLYKLAVTRAFGTPVEQVTPLQRQKVGKVSELAFLFGGSIGAWLRFDAQPDTVTRLVKERFHGTDEWRKAAEQHDKALHRYGLSTDAWIAIKVVVNGWRASNTRIVSSWWAQADAIVEAVDAPGTMVPVMDGRVKYLVVDDFLWGQIPSGKLLAYANPRLVETREDYLVDADGEMFPIEEFTADELALRTANGAIVKEGRTRLQVMFQGRNQRTGAWGSQRLYGGLLMNNNVQSTAREVLRLAMHRVEEAGYPVTLHCHDELMSEVVQEFGSPEHYQELMSVLPPWLGGLPLAAKAWEDHRYVK